MKSKYTFPTDETRCVDVGICPQCGTRFDPESHKLSEHGHDYNINCPNCNKALRVFESVEFLIQLANEE